MDTVQGPPPRCLAQAPPAADVVPVLATDVALDTAPYHLPQEMAHPRGDDSYWYVALQGGRIVRFDNHPATDTFTEVLDVSDRVYTGHDQLGMMSLAFHPDFAINGQVFVYYNRDASEQGGFGLFSRISRFTSTDGGESFPADSEELVLEVFRSHYTAHNGGHLEFGPDGYLYASLGDGGGQLDPHNHGQNPFTLWGSLLRLDVDGGVPYAIPPDNPFADGIDAAPELYAMGLRNPWQWTFDGTTGEIWLADVGSDLFEEINYIEAGGNYGWALAEGTDCSAVDCSELIEPAHAYANRGVSAVIGGRVSTGAFLPGLQGYYLFADHYHQWLRGIRRDPTTGDFEVVELSGNTGLRIGSFAQDPDDRIWVIDRPGGRFYTLAPPSEPTGAPIPGQLSQTGCVDPSAPSQAADTLIPYDLNVGLWSDGASKERYLRLPEGTTLQVDEEGDLSFPKGTVLMKHFRLDDQLVETRLLMHHVGGLWQGYSYAWDEDQADARLLQLDEDRQIGDQIWHYPSRQECALCHTSQADYAVGPELVQLNRPDPHDGSVNQLDTWDALGLFAEPLPAEATDPAFALPPLDDPGASASERARAYLHANCAHCHRPGGLGPDLRFFGSPGTYCGVIAPGGPVDGADLLLAPGDPQRSVIHARMASTDPRVRMPPLGTSEVDTEALAVVSEWIAGLPGCP